MDGTKEYTFFSSDYCYSHEKSSYEFRVCFLWLLVYPNIHECECLGVCFLPRRNFHSISCWFCFSIQFSKVSGNIRANFSGTSPRPPEGGAVCRRSSDLQTSHQERWSAQCRGAKPPCQANIRAPQRRSGKAQKRKNPGLQARVFLESKVEYLRFEICAAHAA